MTALLDLAQLEGFEWDDGNDTKSWKKHRVSKVECEQLFFNKPLLLLFDSGHSQAEDRYYVLGRTDADRRLFAVFTARAGRIRVISARDMTRTERSRYPG